MHSIRSRLKREMELCEKVLVKHTTDMDVILGELGAYPQEKFNLKHSEVAKILDYFLLCW